jgi:phenylacetate-CoA ligase
MVDDRLKSLYDATPRPIQDLAVTAKGWRLKRRRRGGAFHDLLVRAVERESFSDEELRDYRRRRLSAFLETAADSPFWSEQFDEYGVDVKSTEPFEEVSKLPILTKQDVKDAERSLRPASLSDADLLPCHTSGTTGSGLRFAQTERALREQWAVWWRYRRWHSVDLDTWHGYFGGIPVVPLEESSPPYWRVNRAQNQVMFSTYHLKPETARTYVEAIRDRDLPWLHGYPSALGLLANLVADAGIDPPEALDLVTIGAETLFDHQRAAIEEAFEVPVRQHYGLEEAVANISECPEGNLHIDEDFAHVEFVPLEDGDGHRIVGTNWTNPAFPLFRYDTGDVATLADGGCSCGRPGRVIKSLLGRQDDYVVLPSGARVGRLDHIFKDFESVREAQIYQPDRECMVLRIVPAEEYDDGVERDVVGAARTRLGEEIDIDVVHVEEIERTDSGKMKFVVSDVEGMGIRSATAGQGQ